MIYIEMKYTRACASQTQKLQISYFSQYSIVLLNFSETGSKFSSFPKFSKFYDSTALSPILCVSYTALFSQGIRYPTKSHHNEGEITPYSGCHSNLIEIQLRIFSRNELCGKSFSTYSSSLMSRLGSKKIYCA